MTLNELGYHKGLEPYRLENNLESFELGRVISEHKERYIVRTEKGELDSELIGNLRFTAESRYDFPAVGDWVAISEYDQDKALIHAIYPRHSIIERQAIGKSGQKQIIATNIDYGLIVQAVNRDFNINRLERYLTICNASNVVPVIILSKTDLIDEKQLNSLLDQITGRIQDVKLIALSNESLSGFDDLIKIIEKGNTYCLLGSSGVGKSSLLNNLIGKEQMKTDLISQSTDRGKHVTSHRELFVLETGGIVIDNPGMREVGIADSAIGLETTFDEIVKLSQACKFKDCRHINEKGCAILEAVENEEIDRASYENFQRLQRERNHYESSLLEKRKKDKDFGKMVKNIKNQRKNSKF